MRLLTVVSLLGLAFAEGALAQEAGGGTRLLRSPTVSRDLVALAYAGDLWVVSRSGGAARRLTATPGVEADPRSEEHTSELQSHHDLVCRLLLEKKKTAHVDTQLLSDARDR